VTTSPQQYSPWERTETEDAQIQNALDSASPEQLAGFISDLVKLAESRPQEQTTPTDQ
jgi:hypothetical protein